MKIIVQNKKDNKVVLTFDAASTQEALKLTLEKLSVFGITPAQARKNFIVSILETK